MSTKRILALRSFLYLAALMAISGCSALRENVTVVEPKEGPMARIRVVSGSVVNVRAYPNSECTDNSLPGSGRVISTASVGFEETINGKVIGMPETENSRNKKLVSAEFYAKAGEPMTFFAFRPQTTTESVQGSLKTTTYYRDGCTSAIYFTPEENIDYELSYVGSVGCGHKIEKLLATDSKVNPINIESKIAMRCNKPRKKQQENS